MRALARGGKVAPWRPPPPMTFWANMLLQRMCQIAERPSLPASRLLPLLILPPPAHAPPQPKTQIGQKYCPRLE